MVSRQYLYHIHEHGLAQHSYNQYQQEHINAKTANTFIIAFGYWPSGILQPQRGHQTCWRHPQSWGTWCSSAPGGAGKWRIQKAPVTWLFTKQWPWKGFCGLQGTFVLCWSPSEGFTPGEVHSLGDCRGVEGWETFHSVSGLYWSELIKQRANGSKWRPFVLCLIDLLLLWRF